MATYRVACGEPPGDDRAVLARVLRGGHAGRLPRIDAGLPAAGLPRQVLRGLLPRGRPIGALRRLGLHPAAAQAPLPQLAVVRSGPPQAAPPATRPAQGTEAAPSTWLTTFKEKRYGVLSKMTALSGRVSNESRA